MKIRAILESGNKSGSKKACFILKYVVSYKGIKFRIVRSGTILICSFGNPIRQFALKCAGKQKTKEIKNHVIFLGLKFVTMHWCVKWPLDADSKNNKITGGILY